MTGYRALLGIAAALLAATAGLHWTGLGPVSETLGSAQLAEEWVGVFRGLWVMFSLHLLLVALLLTALAAGVASRPVLLVATAIPIADTALLVSVVGLFPGSVLTGLAALCCLAALAVQPAAARPD